MTREEEYIKSLSTDKIWEEVRKDKKWLDSIKRTYHRDLVGVKWADEHPKSSWIKCSKMMPKETKCESETLQGHREWTESEKVLVCTVKGKYFIDWTHNGIWTSTRTMDIDGFTDEVVAWMPIPDYMED